MPGPICNWEYKLEVDDGTSCRAPMRAPGPGGRVRDPSIFDRAESLYDAYTMAVGLAPQAVATKTGYALGEILKGLLPGLLEMLVVVGVTTAIGGVAGGVIGFFFGGVGAVPGVVVGGEIGLDIGIAAMTWLGLGFLAIAIAQGFGELWSTLSRGIEKAWAAPEYSPRQYPHVIASAAKDIADSVAILMLLILQGLVAWILKRAAVKSTGTAFATANRVKTLGGQAAADAAVAEALAVLRKSRLGTGFADWVEQNWTKLRDDPRLRITSPEKVGGVSASDKPGVPEEIRSQRRTGKDLEAGLDEFNRGAEIEVPFRNVMLKGKVIQAGTNKKVAIVGRNMNPIREYAKKLRAKGYDVELFDPKIISNRARAEWEFERTLYADGIIPDSRVPDLLYFEENRAWVQKLQREGYTVVDLGDPLDSTRPSVFYEMEKGMFR